MGELLKGWDLGAEALQNWPIHRRNRELRMQRTRYILEMISPVLCWGRRCAGGRDREDGQWHGKHIRVDGAEELQVSALESETLWFDCSLYQWAAPWVFAQSALSFLTCKMKLTASSLIGSTEWDNPWKTPDKPPGTKGVLSKCCPLWLLLSKLWCHGRTEC